MFAAGGGFQRGIRSASNFINNGATAKILTAQSKFGGSSGNFQGAKTSSIQVPASSRFDLGTAPFTLETWFYQTAITNRFPVLCGNDYNTRSNFLSGDWNFQPHRDLSGQVRDISFSLGNVTAADAWLKGITQVPLDTWAHACVVRTAASGASMASSSIDASGVLTVGTLSSGTITPGLSLSGTNVVTGTYIQSNISGSGSGSTWQTNATASVASTTITGNNFVLYLDGNIEARGSTAVATGANGRSLAIGTWGTQAAITSYIGYMDEFRLSTVARYFTTFTPATEPFVNDPDTLILLHMDGENDSQVWTDDNT
jgi:hypothetical protein